ncbi:putative acyl carrier protein [Nocardia brasiliensis NBRC 14402]|uniref:acyl carrier protein n=1 Tax=Nocardia brasiliensis TaxID=37326 RepID=UPI0002E7D68D|nr:acyl carrier protein [Nocardia brasiliensis]GAJ86491.1 putative acyl carrier protein [Nocardia brasiliensis NBRC 14402]SUB55445.1 Meromycolate extension acyl carrier protein [Nocardia brasiliensis]
MSVQTDAETMEYLRDMISEVLEIEPEELTETSHFVEDHEADSLRAIEILARIEKKYKVTIPQDRLPEMVNLRAVYDTMVDVGGVTV